MVLDVNRAALHRLGYRKKKLVGKSLKQIYAPESHRKMKRLFSKWKRTGRFKDEEMIITTKKGEKRTVLLSASAVREGNGKIRSSVSVQKDITERERAEETLEQSLSLLRATLESTADGILVVDKNRRWTSFNQKFIDMWGVPDSILA